MAVNVETLDKLERKITLTLPASVIQSEVDTRLKRLARTVKMDGFRPGKVPMNEGMDRLDWAIERPCASVSTTAKSFASRAMIENEVRMKAVAASSTMLTSRFQ